MNGSDSDARACEAWGDRDARSPGLAHAALATFERQVLVFPLLVVVLACASFLFGGTCAAWQWWTAVATVVAAPFVRKDRRRAALAAAGLFAFLLFALRFLLPPIFWDVAECGDMSSCHLPMVQLLIEGWNPVADPTMADILASLDLDVWGMAPLHIAFMPKTLAVFSAVAYTFVNDPRALTFPLPAFLWIGVLLSAIRLFRGFPRWALVSALICILPMVALQMPVDLSLAYASCGLLLTMRDALRKKKTDWLALTVWGTWMFAIKPNGVLGALVFMTAFAILSLQFGKRNFQALAKRLSASLAAVLLLSGVCLWNPLGTSWRMFGHPLYPLRTIDAKHFPVKDLTWDLNLGNNDFHQMGKIGLFVHAYLAPRAATAYYRWKLGKNDFTPENLWWYREFFPMASVRWGIFATFCILLLFKNERIWGITGLFLLFVVPNKYVGYTRYQPWLSSLGCIAVIAFSEWAAARLKTKNATSMTKVSVMAFLLSTASWFWQYARNVECMAEERSIVRDRIRPVISVPRDSIRRGDPFKDEDSVRLVLLTYRENQNRLLVKELGMERTTRVLSLAEWLPPEDLAFLSQDSNDLQSLGGASRLLSIVWDDQSTWRMRLPDILLTKWKVLRQWTIGWHKSPFGYYVPDDEHAEFLHDYYDEPEERAEFSGWKKISIRVGKAFHAWFVTYPKEVCGRFAK